MITSRILTAACVLLACLLGLAIVVGLAERRAAQAATARAEQAEAIAQQAQAHAQALLATIAETERRVQAQEAIARDARSQTLAAEAAAARADAVGRKLRAAYLAVASGLTAPDDPAAPAGSAPASGPGLVLADLLGRTDDTAGELAAHADRARIAGLACERAYDALTQGGQAASVSPASSP